MIFVFRLSIANFLLNQNRVAAFFISNNCAETCRSCQSSWDALTVDDDMIQLEKLLYPRRSRMVSPPSLQIYLQSHMTLTFKLLTTKLTVSCPCHIDHLCQLTSKSVHLFSKYHDHKLDETNERMDERADNVRT